MTHSTLVIQQQNDVMRVDLYQMHQRRLKYAGAADQRVPNVSGDARRVVGPGKGCVIGDVPRRYVVRRSSRHGGRRGCLHL